MSSANHATLGCAFASDDAIIDAIRSLSGDGTVVGWRIGATDKERAARVAQAAGALDDLDPTDPLRGVPGVASSGDAGASVNVGAAVGAVTGAVVGLALSSALGALMPVDPTARTIASSILCFAIGMAVGGVLGGAFGKRPSTHAGFRLIDAMDAGDVAAIGTVDAERVAEVRSALQDRGAAEIVVITG